MKSGHMNKPAASKKDLVPGSKIPIAYLLDYLAEGYTISDFVSAYPWIKKSNVKKVLKEIKKREFTASYAL